MRYCTRARPDLLAGDHGAHTAVIGRSGRVIEGGPVGREVGHRPGKPAKGQFNNVIVTAWRKTDSAGDLKIILGTTDCSSGDNYQVRFGFTKVEVNASVPESQRTCVLTAWKRYYYELDMMVRPRGFSPLVISGFSADLDDEPDVIRVPSTESVTFARGDLVKVFDFETDVGEWVSITDVNTQTGEILLDADIQNDYGTGSKGGGVRTLETNGSTVEEMYFHGNMSKWETALADAFIECASVESGAGAVPFRAFWSDAQMEQFIVDHFDNRLEDFHFWVCGVAVEHYGQDSYGYSLQDSQELEQQHKLNGSFVFQWSIERNEDTSGNVAHWRKLVSSHEGCHNGARPQVDDCTHQSNVTGTGDEKWCLMYQPYGSSDIDFRLHEDHVWELRDSDIP